MRVDARVLAAAGLGLILLVGAGCREKNKSKASPHTTSATHKAAPAPRATPATRTASSSGSRGNTVMCCCFASGVATFVEEPTCKNDMSGSCVADSRCPR